jgi:hypothetical protein
MKTKKFRKKLNLNKKTVANLNGKEMNGVLAGAGKKDSEVTICTSCNHTVCTSCNPTVCASCVETECCPTDTCNSICSNGGFCC